MLENNKKFLFNLYFVPGLPMSGPSPTIQAQTRVQTQAHEGGAR